MYRLGPVKKLGEGQYGEVFSIQRDGTEAVIKVSMPWTYVQICNERDGGMPDNKPLSVCRVCSLGVGGASRWSSQLQWGYIKEVWRATPGNGHLHVREWAFMRCLYMLLDCLYCDSLCVLVCMCLVWHRELSNLRSVHEEWKTSGFLKMHRRVNLYCTFHNMYNTITLCHAWTLHWTIYNCRLLC